VSAGSEASPSPAIDKSMSEKRPKSWKLALRYMSRKPSEMIFAVGLVSGREERTMRSLKALSAAQ